MFEQIRITLRLLMRRAFCHHCLYGLMTLIYLAGCLQLVDKDAMVQAAAAVYLALAVRG